MADCDDPAASGAVSHPYPLAGTAPAFGRPLPERERRASANASHAAHRRHQWGDMSSCGHVDTVHSGRRCGTARSREAGSSLPSPHDVSPRRCRLRGRHHTPCRCPDEGCSRAPIFGRDVCSCRQPRRVALLTVATVAAHPVRCRPAWSEVGTHPTHPTSTRPARKKGPAGSNRPNCSSVGHWLADGHDCDSRPPARPSGAVSMAAEVAWIGGDRRLGAPGDVPEAADAHPRRSN